ncbi:MAG: Xaa-Pro dipeptidase [Paracoccaceae bacterium]|nr:Xaa-Pro dipeptidase [Paracoccaceae bacterium]
MGSLRSATSIKAEFLAMIGELNPRRDGPFGAIDAGAFSDTLWVSGIPLEGTEILIDYEEIVDVIMRNGLIYRKDLEES